MAMADDSGARADCLQDQGHRNLAGLPIPCKSGTPSLFPVEDDGEWTGVAARATRQRGHAAAHGRRAAADGAAHSSTHSASGGGRSTRALRRRRRRPTARKGGRTLLADPWAMIRLDTGLPVALPHVRQAEQRFMAPGSPAHAHSRSGNCFRMMQLDVDLSVLLQDGVRCPRCGNEEGDGRLKSRPFHWLCRNLFGGKATGSRSSVGTIFENSNISVCACWFKDDLPHAGQQEGDQQPCKFSG